MVVELKDLVVLAFASNNCYVHVRSVENYPDPVLRIDVANGTWSYHHWKGLPVGRQRFIDNWKEGVIGVYNSRDVSHLDQMVRDARELVGTNPICMD